MVATDTTGQTGVTPFFNESHISVRSEVLIFQEDVQVRRHFPRQSGQRKGGGTRNKIQSRSKESMNRLSFHLRNDPADLRYMVTLTYPRLYPSNGTEAKGHLKALQAWLRRRGIGGYWVMEFQNRGAVHFHLFIVARVKVTELRDAWNRIIREYRPDGEVAQVRIQRMNRAAMVVYAVKRNQAKVPDSFADTGRFWGCFNLPKYEPLQTIQGTQEETAPIIRIVRRAVNGKRRKRLRIDKGRNSFTLHGGGKIARYGLARNQSKEPEKPAIPTTPTWRSTRSCSCW